MSDDLETALGDLSTLLTAVQTLVGDVDSVEGRMESLGSSGRDLVDGLTNQLMSSITTAMSEASAELAQASTAS